MRISSKKSAAISLNKKVVIVMPAYNAEKTLLKTYKEISSLAYDEIILVDDKSTDQTKKLAKKLDITFFQHDINQGYGANQKTCYKEALKKGADIVVMLHPDYQYDPTILPSMVVPIIFGYADVVLGSRMLSDPHAGGALQGGMPIYKYISNKFLTFVQNYKFKMHLSEYHTGYRAYSREVLNSVNFDKFSNDFIFDNQILIACIRKGYRFKEVPVKTRYFKEASSINLGRSIRYGYSVLIETFKA
jgi:glycosyltransferase involved in cell wall biosynthesis